LCIKIIQKIKLVAVLALRMRIVKADGGRNINNGTEQDKYLKNAFWVLLLLFVLFNTLRFNNTRKRYILLCLKWCQICELLKKMGQTSVFLKKIGSN